MKVLCSPFTSDSAERLAKELNCGVEKNVYTKEDILIRWGTTVFIKQKPVKVLNSRNAVACAVDKTRMMLKFKSTGVPSPRFWTRASETILPSIFRTRYHTQGQGLFIVKTKKDAKRLVTAYDGYFVQLIPKFEEYRLFVVKNKVILCYVKRRSIKKANCLIWNDTNGWKLTLCKTLPNVNVANAAIKAVKSLGLNFGAVDLCIDRRMRPFVFEVNTGPELTMFRARQLADALRRFYDLPQPPEILPEAVVS